VPGFSSFYNVTASVQTMIEPVLQLQDKQQQPLLLPLQHKT
jgi:hypothetical protein